MNDRDSDPDSGSDSEDSSRSRYERLGRGLAEFVHDLRNPLGSLSALSELLSARVEGDLDPIANEIGANVRQARELVEDLLYFAQGRQAPLEDCDLVPLFSDYLATRRARRDGIEVDWEPRIGSFAMRARPRDLLRLLSNLIRNAEDAMASDSRRGRIRVFLHAQPSEATLIVEDEGPGFRKEGSDNEDASSSASAGLGLGICRRVAAEHGGSLEISSTESEGARISVRLRAARSESEIVESSPISAPEEEPAFERPSSGGSRILVVDDDLNVCATYERVLALDDHEVSVAHTGLEGLRLFQTENPDLAIVDLKLPDLPGEQFFQRLQRDVPGQERRIVFATGEATNEEARKFLDSTGNPYLIKPFEIEELRSAIQSILEDDSEPMR